MGRIFSAHDDVPGRLHRIASASIAAQALDAGLTDEVIVSLVPVMLGQGIPCFGGLVKALHRFGDPVIIAGRRATHLRYAVER